MLKDISFEKVQDVAVAIVPQMDHASNEIVRWKVFLINLKSDAIVGVLITSTGYGVVGGKRVATSTLRQFFERVEARQFVALELISKELFAINNEFWVSFWHQGSIYDKRYIFVTDSIAESNLTDIPLMGCKGVMIR